MVMEDNESSNEEEESPKVEEIKEDYKWDPILQLFLFLFLMTLYELSYVTPFVLCNYYVHYLFLKIMLIL